MPGDLILPQHVAAKRAAERAAENVAIGVTMLPYTHDPNIEGESVRPAIRFEFQSPDEGRDPTVVTLVMREAQWDAFQAIVVRSVNVARMTAADATRAKRSGPRGT